MVTAAEKFLEKPDAAWRKAIKSLPATSKASESTATHVREFDDGSRAYAESSAGDPATVRHEPIP